MYWVVTALNIVYHSESEQALFMASFIQQMTAETDRKQERIKL